MSDAEILLRLKVLEEVVEAARVFYGRSITNAEVNGAICQTQEVWGARWNLGTRFDALDT